MKTSYIRKISELSGKIKDKVKMNLKKNDFIVDN